MCRFEVKADPGQARSGLVYSGKIYETDGANPIAVHEAADVRPLSPIPHAPSLRIFHTDYQLEELFGDDPEGPSFFYSNPGMLAGASQVLPYPDWSTEVSAMACVVATIVGDVYQISVDEADNAVLGYTLMTLLVAKDSERRDRRVGSFGKAFGVGGVIGPVLTTPDELNDDVLDEQFGSQFQLEAVMRVNGVERGRGSLEILPFTFAQAISAASFVCPLRVGDLIAIGPVTQSEESVIVEPGDEIQIAVAQLGALSLKLSNPS